MHVIVKAYPPTQRRNILARPPARRLCGRRAEWGNEMLYAILGQSTLDGQKLTHGYLRDARILFSDPANIDEQVRVKTAESQDSGADQITVRAALDYPMMLQSVHVLN